MPAEVRRRNHHACGPPMSADSYTDVLADLYALEAAKGMDFKLERVTLALEHLGNPHRRYPVVHIAGTNGKGSVAAMLHAILTAAGSRVGLYTSPHLLSFTERIRVGADTIAEAAVVQRAREIGATVTSRGIDLTFFEFATVMAFVEFARQAVDIAVVEVGLGGRLDATNVVDPAVAVITTIGLDHEAFLGTSIASIAAEKGGIIKPGRPLVVGNVPATARTVIEGLAAQCRAGPSWFATDFAIDGDDPFRFRMGRHEIADLRVALRGGHQRENAACAIAAALRLRDVMPVPEAAIRHGLAHVQWPGRLQVLQETPLVVVDGAHNLEGVRTLTRELPALVGSRRIHLLFAVMRDKRWQPMVDVLGPIAASATVTTVLPPRGEVPLTLAAAFAPHCPVSVARTPASGLTALLHRAGRGDAIVVAGSLFLVGEALAALRLPHPSAPLFAAPSPA